MRKYHQFLYVIFIYFCFLTNINITLGDGNEVELLDNNNENTRRSNNNPLSDFYAKSVTIDLKIDDYDEKIQKVLNEQISSRRSAIDAALRREELDSGEKNDSYRRENNSPLDDSKVEGTDEPMNQDQLDATKPRGRINSEELQSGEKQRITNETQQGGSEDVGVRLLDIGEDPSDIFERINSEPETTIEPIALRRGMHRGKKAKKASHDKFLIECLTQKKNCDKHRVDQSAETENNYDDRIIRKHNPFAPHGEAAMEDKNLTKLAYVISKHIVNSLPKDMRKSNWAADLAFKIVYEKLKMYHSGNYVPFGLPFRQNYMYGNASNDCGCCCSDDKTESSDASQKSQLDSQIDMKVGNESKYKCLPTIDKPPSEGYVLLENVGWFKFNTERKPWNEARKQCYSEGAHLAFIESPQEAEWCMDQLLKGPAKEVFLGIHNFYRGDWVSVTDTDVEKMKHLKWSKKDSAEYRSYNCAIINLKDKLVSRESCTVDHPFICKVPL